MSPAAAGTPRLFWLDAEKQRADVVNLGYVINVIEDLRQALGGPPRRSELCEDLLVVGRRTNSPAIPQ